MAEAQRLPLQPRTDVIAVKLPADTAPHHFRGSIESHRFQIHEWVDPSMKLHPPRVEVDDTEPFRNALFGREQFGRSLLQLLRRTEEGLVIFVNAPWGEGKTTFSRMFRALIRSEKLSSIYFDAYASDATDEPFIAFSAEILDFSRSQLSGAKAKASEKRFKKAAIEVGKRLIGTAVKAGLRLATAGVADSEDLGKLKDTLSDVTKETGEVIAAQVEQQIDDYAAEKESFTVFKNDLAVLAALHRKEHGFPLTIIVDELDRCRPSYALALLERIKHLFDVEGVAFVLLMNLSQMENYVSAIYGEKVDARGYLLKFATLYVDLPRESDEEPLPRGYRSFCHGLMAHHDFPIESPHDDQLVKSMTCLSQHFRLSLREVEKVFVTMALYFAARPKEQFTDAFAVAMLATFKLKRPELFHRLAAGSITLEELLKESRLDRLPTNSSRISQSWVNEFLEFCLLPEDKWSEKTGNVPTPFGSWIGRYDLDRKRVLPFLCARLSQFSPTVATVE